VEVVGKSRPSTFFLLRRGSLITAGYDYTDHLQLYTLRYRNGGTDLLNLPCNYGTNNNGEIRSITDARGSAYSTSFTYDALGRLSEALPPVPWRIPGLQPLSQSLSQSGRAYNRRGNCQQRRCQDREPVDVRR
jgi:YD repeat-containing protein